MLSFSDRMVELFCEEITEVLTNPQKQPADHILHHFKGLSIKQVHKRRVICGLLCLLLFVQ